MRLKSIYLSVHSDNTVYSNVDIDSEIEGLEIKDQKLSEEAARKIVGIIEADIQDPLEARLRSLSRARLQPSLNLIEAKAEVVEEGGDQ
jgi:hypothetical protein